MKQDSTESEHQNAVKTPNSCSEAVRKGKISNATTFT